MLELGSRSSSHCKRTCFFQAPGGGEQSEQEEEDDDDDDDDDDDMGVGSEGDSKGDSDADEEMTEATTAGDAKKKKKQIQRKKCNGAQGIHAEKGSGIGEGSEGNTECGDNTEREAGSSRDQENGGSSVKPKQGTPGRKQKKKRGKKAKNSPKPAHVPLGDLNKVNASDAEKTLSEKSPGEKLKDKGQGTPSAGKQGKGEAGVIEAGGSAGKRKPKVC